MSENFNQYDNPLISRYASPEMSGLWSPQRKFGTWRRLWVALAEAEAELGLAISPQQIEQLKAHLDDIDFEAAARYERKLRHDVMAHVHTYGDVCPDARAIIHLGATSCYVTDNTDLLLLREGLQMIARRVAAVIDSLGSFAVTYLGILAALSRVSAGAVRVKRDKEMTGLLALLDSLVSGQDQALGTTRAVVKGTAKIDDHLVKKQDSLSSDTTDFEQVCRKEAKNLEKESPPIP